MSTNNESQPYNYGTQASTKVVRLGFERSMPRFIINLYRSKADSKRVHDLLSSGIQKRLLLEIVPFLLSLVDPKLSGFNCISILTMDRKIGRLAKSVFELAQYFNNFVLVFTLKQFSLG